MEKKEGDEFVVDDLFDFSKGEFEDGFLQNVENEKEDKNYCVPVGNEVKTEDDGFGSGSSGELCIPVDDVADLEWLSHFVEDSFSGYSVPFLVKSTEAVEKTVRETPDKTKVRRHWKKIDITKDIDGCKAHQALCCSLCGAQKTPKWHAGPMGPKTLCNACGVRYQPVRETLDQTKVRRHKKNLGIAIDTAGCGSYQAPQCSHCGVQDTPQWRAGPMGPKTLCNACGVRHKSGRLLPEYRPACSPTFSSEVHSNSHRKVLEMRRKKEEGPVYVSQDLDF